MNRSRLVMCAAAMLAAACQDRQSVTSAPFYMIQDHFNSGGNPHFYLLPPVVSPPTITEKFNRGLSPVVRITDQTCHAGQIAFYTATTGPGSTVVMDASNHQYGIVWQTKNFPNVVAPCVYRIQVELDGQIAHEGLRLGFADVEVVDNGAQMKNVNTGLFVPLLDDRSLPFKFFIGFGAAFYTLTGDDACRAGRDCGEAVVTQGQNTTILTDQQLAGIFIPGTATTNPDLGDLVVVIEQRPHSDGPCIPQDVMSVPQFDDCYRYVTFPVASRQTTEGEFNPPFRFNTDVTVGMCVEVGNLTPAQQARLQIFRFEPEPTEDIPQLEALPDAPATFLPCDPNFQPGGSGGITGLLRQGWRLVMNRLRVVAGPQPLYASNSVIHLGLGGSSCCTSYFTWGLPPAVSGQIAFASNRDGNFEIYVVNADGTGSTRLTTDASIDAEPAWSPDGSKIAFQSRRAGLGDIFVMNADGSNPVNLTQNPNEFQLTPDWSRDGTKIAYMNRGSFDRIFVMNADGSNNTFVAGTATADAGFPSWSPDGTKIAFATQRDGNLEIYVMNADGSNPVNLTQNSGFDFTPKWSPNGTKIAFFTSRDGNGEVYVMNADGTNPVNLTNNPANDRVGGWSADSRFIVFDSDRDGNSEIYVMQADGTGVTRVTSNSAEDNEPAFKP